MRPGPAVLASFGVSADPVSLPGGEGTAWRAGQAVLKPVGDPRVARWTADLYRDLGPLTACRDAGFRVPRPLGTAAGDWVAQDPLGGAWVAWQWLPGEPASWAGVSPSWPGLIAASRAFHAALAGRPAPPWLGRDGSQWTIGDQVAWGERDPGGVLAAAPGSLAGPTRPSSLSWPASRSLTSCSPVRTSAGSSPRSSSGAVTRTLPPGSRRSRGQASR